jgi:hypothetical protein
MAPRISLFAEPDLGLEDFTPNDFFEDDPELDDQPHD